MGQLVYFSRTHRTANCHCVWEQFCGRVAAGTQPEALFDATLEPTLRQPLLYFLPPKTLHCKIHLYTIKFKNLPIKKYGSFIDDDLGFVMIFKMLGQK